LGKKETENSYLQFNSQRKKNQERKQQLALSLEHAQGDGRAGEHHEPATPRLERPRTVAENHDPTGDVEDTMDVDACAAPPADQDRPRRARMGTVMRRPWMG
jgi:hypothetical protein